MSHVVGKVHRRIKQGAMGWSGAAPAAMPHVRAILYGSRVQAKLKIGAANDPAEAEADRVADRVMRMPVPVNGTESPAISAHSGAAPVQRVCAECEQELNRKPADQTIQRQAEEEEEVQLKRSDDAVQRQEEEEELIQTKEAPGAGPAVTASSEGAIQSLRGGGAPMPASERAFFEPRFGRSFDNVRVHDGPRADAAAKSINARAFTLGNDVAFARGEYRPGSSEGRQLLAHELTHVIQSSNGKVGSDPFLRRMERGAAGGSPRANFVVTPDDEAGRVDAAIAIVERMSNNRADFPRCHRFFTDNCPGGTNTSFTDAVDDAVVWKLDPNPLGWLGATHGNTHHISYTRVPYDVSRWAIAATLVHELMHTCGQDDHDIGDQAKHVCGRLPNI